MFETCVSYNNINFVNWWKSEIESHSIKFSLTYTDISLFDSSLHQLCVLCRYKLSVYSFTATQPPTNVRATVLTPRSVVVTWTVSSSPNVTGYIISYTTTASYTSGGSVTVSGGTTTRGTLNNLEESTTYTITVQAISNNGNANSNAVSVTTYTDGK